MALAYMRPDEIRQLTQYDQFAGVWREIDDGRLEGLRSHADLQIYINDKQKGVTPLFLAIKRKEVQMVLLLLANGADPNIPCKEATPLWLACFHGLVELVHPLLDNGADPNVLCSGASPLHVAAARGLVEVVHILLSFERPANVNLNSERLGTALHVAVARGHKYILEALLEYKPDLNVQNRFGETIFHIACSMSDDDIANKLLDTKLDIDPFITDRRRNSTAAHVTTSVAVFKRLIKRWPQLFHALDRYERTPTFYLPCNIVALLSSLTEKVIKHNGELLHADIPRYADIALVCPAHSLKIADKVQKPKVDGSSNGGAETEKVLAHKAMLYARLPYFAELLKSKISKTFVPATAEGSEPELLEVPEHSADVMRAVVHYAYTDELKCPKASLKELIIAAREFGVKRLADLARLKLAESVEPEATRFVADMTALITSTAFADVLVVIPATAATSNTSAAPSAAASSSAAAAPRKYPLHRFILATFSEYFRTMFSIGMRESQSGIVELEPTSPLIFEAYIHWIYTFALKSTLKGNKDSFRLLELSHSYMTPDLSLPIQNKILIHLKNEEWASIDSTFPEADRLGAQIVAEQCALHFNSLREVAKKRMDPESLKRLELLATPIIDATDDEVKPARHKAHRG